MPPHDKVNKVDFSWHIVRTLPHQERKLAAMLRADMPRTDNILEVYCPTRTAVSTMRGGKDVKAPLFAGYVFVLSTEAALKDFLRRRYPEGTIMHGRRESRGARAGLMVIPEKQMRAFMDFNENYADRIVILERPYSDYAFNPKTGEPNEIVRVIDGPLAGREGYIARFRRDKRMVFKMKAIDTDRYYTVSVPDVWTLHVVRLHNAEGDRYTLSTVKERAADLLAGMLQSCGYGGGTAAMLHSVIERLAAKPSIASLCRELTNSGHEALGNRIAAINTAEAGLIINLARYEHDNPGYARKAWPHIVIRPFLTPTSGPDIAGDTGETRLQHKDFTEIIRRVSITEQAYYPSREQDATLTTTYYAHVGVIRHSRSGFIIFANWDTFLAEYYMTAGKANEKLVSGTVSGHGKDRRRGDRRERLIDSFRNFAPTLYNVLTDEASPVKPVNGLNIGGETLNVMAITTADAASGTDLLIRTCTDICREITATTHLAIWRRYLRTVWLHT